MASYTANLPTAFISSGSASSSVILGFEDADALIIMAPATLTGTCTVRVATESSGITASSTFADYTSGGSDVTVAAGNAVQFTPPVGGSIILVSASSEAGLRAFQVMKRFSI